MVAGSWLSPGLSAHVVALLLSTLLALTAGTAPAFSAPPVDRYQRLEDMHHTVWTARDGLTGALNSLAQTMDGFLWIGTSNGLFRFDGVTFEHYEPETGPLPANSITTLFAARDGGLWVGHGEGASLIRSDGRAVHYTTADGLPLGVREFAEDQDGAMWVAAVGGLARFEAGRWHDVRARWGYPCRSAWRLLVQRDGTLWVAAASPDKLLFLPRGAHRFQDAGVDVRMLSLVESDARTILGSDDEDGEIHEVRREGEGATARRTGLKVPATTLAIDSDRGVWFAGFGLSRLRLDRFPTSDRSGPPVDAMPPGMEHVEGDKLSGAIARAVLIDRERTIWVVTNGGLNRFRRRNLTWTPEPDFTVGAHLLTDEAGETWIVPWVPPYLKRLSDRTPVAGAPPQLRLAFPALDGGLYFASRGQLLHWAGGAFEPVPPPDEVASRGYRFAVLAGAKDRAGRLWASVNGVGLFHLKDGRWTLVPVLPDRHDWAPDPIVVDNTDRVWLGYRSELAVRESDGRISRYTKAHGLDVGLIRTIASHRSHILVGGDRGVALLHGGRFHALRTATGDDLGNVRQIIVTADGIWMSAAIGIGRIQEGELQRLFADPAYRVRLDLLDLASDLPDPLRPVSGGANAAVDRDGVLWFVTERGLARVDPRLMVRNSVPPPVVVRSADADGAELTPRGTVQVPALTRTLRIDYTALSLVLPERVRFRYRLEGWETGWHDVGARRSATYTDLKPGRYAFHVLASNNDGVWNDTGARLAFIVAPAWYQTAWFQGGVAAALVLGLLTLYRLRLRSVAAALSARFDERLAERTRLARELHDTLLQTIQGSKLVADHALEQGGDPERLRGAMERLSQWLGRAVEEGRAALSSLRGPVVEADDLASAFQRMVDDPTRPAELTVAVNVHGEARNLHPIVRDEIYRVGSEAMRNACLHARATRLDVDLTYAHDLTLVVADNGAGMDPAIAASGRRGRFGLPGMRERAANIDGTLTVESGSSGTRITLVVPGRSLSQRRSNPAQAS